ncbi:MAG: hypothetical protein JJU40_09105 [Rhodobacteraceae bacterium]|nr:hypothetical protein [Paracoccaceae bacterium]
MQIVYHMGAHCTDEGQLLRCLLANRTALAEEGIEIAEPSRYRPIIGETLNALRGAPAGEEVQQTMLDAILAQDAPKRVVLSHDAYLGIPARVLENGRFYPVAPSKTAALRNLFPSHDVFFAMGLRNPATFLPALFQKMGSVSVEDFAALIDPMSIRWSDMLRGIRAQNPGTPLLVWCNEDTPLLWHEIVRMVSGHPAGMALRGRDDYLGRIMTEEGMRRMADYMESHPPGSEAQRRRVVSAFLDKFARPDQIEMEIDMPGWTEDYVEELSERYEEDLFTIEKLPGVTLLTP